MPRNICTHTTFLNLTTVVEFERFSHVPYWYCQHVEKVSSSNEPSHDKTNKMACAPSKDSDQSGHLPTLIRVFALRMKKPWALSYPMSAQQRLWSDWADAHADLSLRWVHTHFIGFVVLRLIFRISRHAKRTTITADDVKLLVRKTPRLVRLQTYMCINTIFLQIRQEFRPDWPLLENVLLKLYQRV